MDDLAEAVRRSFTPGTGTRRIAAEVELFALGPARATGLRGLPDGAVLSAEPGGQVEVALAPRASAAHLAADVIQAVRAVGRTTRVHLSGTHPTHTADEVPLVLDTPRYLAMQELFDRTGPEGRQMMRTTASLQVCVDRLPGAAGAEQWLVANLAGPALVAAFCASGERTAIWRAIDPTRTGYDGRHLSADDPVGAYTEFARAAERLSIPEAADPAYHLGTLFPPVRPRPGYLELRFLDAQPLHRVREVLETVAALLLDDQARRAALGLLLPTLPHLDDRWSAAERGKSPEVDALLSIATPREVSA